MRRSRILLPGLLITAVLPALSCFSAAPAKAPDAREVLSILETNKPAGMTEAEFNSAAVQGLLSALGPKATISSKVSDDARSASPISNTEVFDGSIVRIRIERVEEGLPDLLSKNISEISKTNKLQGVVLDLRYATGDDYKSAAEAADLFLAKAHPMMNWGEGMKSSTAKANAITVPVAVLVNERTAGAPEALAAVLRATGAGLILGNRTAGAAAIRKTFELSNGAVLRVGVRPIELSDGAKLSGRVRPDIEIQIGADEERAYYADAFAVLTGTNQLAGLGDGPGTNGANRVTRRTRFNEADLVREHNMRARGEGGAQDERKPDGPVVSDPVLARAIDVLKGLAVVRQGRS